MITIMLLYIVIPETIKLLEENIGRTLFDINHSNIFLDPSPRVMEIKTTINKWDLIKLKRFSTAKDIIKQKDNLQHGRKYLQAMQLTRKQSPKYTNSSHSAITKKQNTKNPVKKWTEDLNRHSSKEDIRWPKGTWKDTQPHWSLKKCKLKLQWGIISHWSEWPSSKSLQTVNAGEDMKKRQPSYAVGGNTIWYNH